MMDNTPRKAWEICKKEGRCGTGNWDAWDQPIDALYNAADHWKKHVKGLNKGWLCWCVNDDWCIVQQKLVHSIGWTPIVGWDRNCNIQSPTIMPYSVAIDFNSILKLPVMFFHFPLELSHLWIKKLAFWHSDLLLRSEKIKVIGDMFDELQNGEVAAVYSNDGLRNILNFRRHRYWELIGCTTRDASFDQFNNGTGWWRHIDKHPNCPKSIKEIKNRKKLSYEHGVGILYWKKKYGGTVRNIKLNYVSEGHFTGIGEKTYRSEHSKNEELSPKLEEAIKKLNLHGLVQT